MKDLSCIVRVTHPGAIAALPMKDFSCIVRVTHPGAIAALPMEISVAE
jgi:hypothetical protein